MHNRIVLHLKIREPDFLPLLKHFGHSVRGGRAGLHRVPAVLVVLRPSRPVVLRPATLEGEIRGRGRGPQWAKSGRQTPGGPGLDDGGQVRLYYPQGDVISGIR